MNNITNLIDSVKGNINVISENIYQQKINEAIAGMNDFLNNITDLVDEVSHSDLFSEEEIQKCVEIMRDSLSAMENKDYTLLADVLQYDMIELLDEYSTKLE